ncbi:MULTISPECIES: glycosyltransferase family 2 protein [unclassified Pseudomonas]|uniref:glycosyltransferase family 2 protein n=1 Tax=unclassified Pseudomonas TaxID=196821 RepID=UPI002AC8C9FB|nr:MULTISPECIES: glycosyltransferase family 2 protein [unclassified Pseudomonas]MEB0047228.1 glycosyltransferase family 2 protein [Pseudomonas sp. Dout3]MEB0096868.1 glycosyltransferase family 2 protein [Pseudomonas sp. DC1.2]WPX57380.1 glycosyltransferase family 2 protein [Pseudomonas sp. DC1.2]
MNGAFSWVYMNSQVLSICAVVVTYHPDLENLKVLLASLTGQVAEIVVVDNGSPESLESFVVSQRLINNVAVLSLGENLGIGYAQNVGIDYARNAGASYVAFFDQDSCPESNMIERLHTSAVELQLTGVRLAAVAPSYKDTQGGALSSFVRLGIFGFKRTACVEGAGLVEADFLISSGSLIPMSVIEDVGKMDSSLFIDHVDTEWCFRAKSKGYRLFGVCNAVMLHTLGDRRVRVWFLRWRTVPYHSPFRYYYMFRNSILLQRRSYMPLGWKLADINRCLSVFLFFGIFSSSRSVCLKMMWRGLRDGMIGVTGKIK